MCPGLYWKKQKHASTGASSLTTASYHGTACPDCTPTKKKAVSLIWGSRFFRPIHLDLLSKSKSKSDGGIIVCMYERMVGLNKQDFHPGESPCPCVLVSIDLFELKQHPYIRYS